MGATIKAKELGKFAKIACTKLIDLDDISHCDTYEEYVEYQSTFFNLNIVDSKNILEEEEFNLCKEVMKVYAK